MVMKDKLVKNHHKGMYYRMRRATIILLASFTFAAAIVVPTYIFATSQKNTATGFAAEKVEVNDNSEAVEENEKSEENEYEKYINE